MQLLERPLREDHSERRQFQTCVIISREYTYLFYVKTQNFSHVYRCFSLKSHIPKSCADSQKCQSPDGYRFQNLFPRDIRRLKNHTKHILKYEVIISEMNELFWFFFYKYIALIIFLMSLNLINQYLYLILVSNSIPHEDGEYNHQNSIWKHDCYSVIYLFWLIDPRKRSRQLKSRYDIFLLKKKLLKTTSEMNIKWFFKILWRRFKRVFTRKLNNSIYEIWSHFRK